MALSFIGKPISLISHSDVRYRGILAGIDPQASTIQLENVYSMGTETRRPPQQFIAPVPEPYAYIIFRASEVKDLAVDDQAAAPPPQHNVHDDPAVLGAAPPAAKPQYPTYAAQAATGVPSAQPAQVQQNTARGLQQQQNRRPNAVHTAAASLETVERAMNDLRVGGGSNHHAASNGVNGARGGRRGRGGRGGGGSTENQQIKVPDSDFDFEGSNAKFDKAAAKGTEDDASGEDKAEEKEAPAYNPKASFFDSLSSGAGPTEGGARGGGRGRRGGGGGGGGMGRNRRDEEREKNVATFGEPGGVGLLGPGGYVGGWGGYGRRGGRPRRGGGGGGRGGAGAGAQTQAAVARG